MCSDFDYNIDYPNIVFQNNKMKVLLPKKISANPLKVKITSNNKKQSKYKPKFAFGMPVQWQQQLKVF